MIPLDLRSIVCGSTAWDMRRLRGTEGLQGALGQPAAQPWWYSRMETALQLDPVERITQWSFFLSLGRSDKRHST